MWAHTKFQIFQLQNKRFVYGTPYLLYKTFDQRCKCQTSGIVTDLKWILGVGFMALPLVFIGNLYTISPDPVKCSRSRQAKYRNVCVGGINVLEVLKKEEGGLKYENETSRQRKHFPKLIKSREAILVQSTVKLLQHRKRREIQRKPWVVAGLALHELLLRVASSVGEDMSGMDKLAAPLCAVQCPWPAADHAQQAQSLCPQEIFDGEHTKIWGDVLQFQVWQSPASSLIWRHATILHWHIQIPGHVVWQNIILTTAADAALRPFTAGTFRVKKCVQENVIKQQAAWLLTYGSSEPMQFLLACTQARSGQLLSYNRATLKEMDNPNQKSLLTKLTIILGIRDTSSSWCVMRGCGLEPLQFNWFGATMCLYSSLTQCNSTAAKKVYMLTCDWAPGLMIAGLPIFYQPWVVWYKSTCSKKKLRSKKSLTSVLLLWTSDRDKWHLEFRTPYSDGCPREHNSKTLTYNK